MSTRRGLGLVLVAVAVLLARGNAEMETGLVARWDFDEGKGGVAHDSSGNGNDGKIYDAEWVKLPKGYALQFNGSKSYVDCGRGSALDLTGSATIETWVYSMTIPMMDVGIAGNFFSGYQLTQCRGGCYWYIASGGNNCSGSLLPINTWHHVVGTFDGTKTNMSLYVDGKEMGRRSSRFPGPQKGKECSFLIGRMVPDPTAEDPNYGNVSLFNGMLDAVRVYNRAISAGEVSKHYRDDAANYGIDPTWFDRMKITLYPYFDKSEIVVEFDCRGFTPDLKNPRIVAQLQQGGTTSVVCQKEMPYRYPRSGLTEISFSMKGIPMGDYEVNTVFMEGERVRSAEKAHVTYQAPSASVTSPDERRVPALPPAYAPPSYKLEVCDAGGFKINVKGKHYSFESEYSYPYGGYNTLSATSRQSLKGEKSWKVTMREVNDGEFTITASGQYYSIERHLYVQPTRVYVKDTIKNQSDNDLGMLIHNRLDFSPKVFTNLYLNGFKLTAGRTENETDKAGSPSVFAGCKELGFGIVPLDDVFIVQAVMETNPRFVSAGTEKFGLAKGASCMLEWAVYPVCPGDYFDFSNAVRKDEGRIGTVDGGFGFITEAPSPLGRRQVVNKEYVRIRNIKYGCIVCLSHAADDPDVSVEGIEFTDFPKEMELLKKQIADIHNENPGLKVMFHVCPNLYTTDKPERFNDSKIIGANGKQGYWGDNGTYIKLHRQKEGWQFWGFYPSPGNSFHNALMKSADVMMDELGCNGVFADGFMWGYAGFYTYDKWDGHTVEMDRKNKTIQRKMASVALLSQPSLVEFSRKIRDKGGVVVANNSIMTRTIARETYLIHDLECRTTSELQLAPVATALSGGGRSPSDPEKVHYLDVLGKLRMGLLFFYYWCPNITYESLPSQSFPMTFEEIRSGLVKGPDRIVTMNSGVYGWSGDRNLHFIYKCDGRGAFVPHDFMTTVDGGGVRTEMRFDENESAVLKKIPIAIKGATPVNVLVRRYDKDLVELVLNGKTEATLVLRSGEFVIVPGTDYLVKTESVQKTTADIKGTLAVPLGLNGLTEIRIQRCVDTPAGR